MSDVPGVNWKRGLVVGGILGVIAGALWFAWCCVLASLPAVTPVSLSLLFRPWWRNWRSALIVAGIFGILFGTLAAIRPRT